MLWSHYGNSHSGYRLHFSTEFLKRNGIEEKEVKYRNKRISMDVSTLTDEPIFKERIFKSMYTKGRHWKYEKEVRFLINPMLCVHNKNLDMDFIDFPPSALRRIDLGIRSKPEIVESLESIVREVEYQHVEIYQACIHDDEFRVSYERKF